MYVLLNPCVITLCVAVEVAEDLRRYIVEIFDDFLSSDGTVSSCCIIARTSFPFFLCQSHIESVPLILYRTMSSVLY